jgi:hypothetical protein
MGEYSDSGEAQELSLNRQWRLTTGEKKRKRRESEEARKYADSLRVGRAVAFPNGNVERNRAI